MSTTIIFISVFMTSVLAEISMTTKVSGEFKDSNIDICNSNEDCSLICLASESCVGATFNCPGGGKTCSLNCDVGCCDDITINAQNTRELLIHCEEAGCPRSIINAINVKTTVITCFEDVACTNSTFNLDVNNIIIDCPSDISCDGMNINAANGRDLMVHCGEPYACTKTEIECPSRNCDITCVGNESCSNMIISDQDGYDGNNPSCDDTSASSCDNTIIQYGTDFTNSCEMQYDGTTWSC
eukprot:196977_1